MRCWDGHTVAHTPNEMHQSSAEGMRGGGPWLSSLEAGTEGPGRQRQKAWQWAGGGPGTVTMP